MVAAYLSSEGSYVTLGNVGSLIKRKENWTQVSGDLASNHTFAMS
jgi:hypothetical protein